MDFIISHDVNILHGMYRETGSAGSSGTTDPYS
jgi:hypothetical protein